MKSLELLTKAELLEEIQRYKSGLAEIRVIQRKLRALKIASKHRKFSDAFFANLRPDSPTEDRAVSPAGAAAAEPHPEAVRMGARSVM